MRPLVIISLFSYLVGESYQFPQNYAQHQSFRHVLCHPNQDMNLLQYGQQQFYVPGKRQANHIPRNLRYGQEFPQDGAWNQIHKRDQIQQGGYRQSPRPDTQDLTILGGCYGDGRRPCEQTLITTTTPDVVRCTSIDNGSGSFEFTCDGPKQKIYNKNVLWLQTPDINQNVKITIPNYEIQELIQAGFKDGKGQTKINLVLQPPKQIVDAQRNEGTVTPVSPDVNIKYGQVGGEVIHFQNNRNYAPPTPNIFPDTQSLRSSNRQYQQLIGAIRPPYTPE